MSEQISEAELWTQLGHAEGEERANLLLELADRKIDVRDLSAAASLLQTAADVGREIGDAALAGRAMDQLGRVLFSDHEPAAAAEAHEAAADLFRDAGWDDRVAASLWALADSLRVQGKWDEMLAVADNGLTVAEADDNEVGVANLSLQRAKALYQLDREEEALAESARARDRFRRAEMPSGVAEVDEFAHRVCMYLGRYDEALELATNCYVLAGTTHTDVDEAMAEQRLAETHIARQEADEALAFADRVRARFREKDDAVGVARAARVRGQALALMGRDREALDAFVEARVMFDANGWDHEARECEFLRAVRLHVLGRYGEAEAINARLAIDARQEGSPEGEAWAVMRRMDNLGAAEEWDRVVEVGQRWKDSAADVNGESVRSPRVHILALLAFGLWASTRRDEAFEVAEEALGQITDEDLDRVTALVFEVRGRYLLDSDERSGRQELAHAVALYLAHGAVDQATDLSQFFLPGPLPTERRKETPPFPGTARESS